MSIILQIDTHRGVPIYRQVVDQLRAQILSRQIPPGSQLTSVRQLAAELKVNPMTISKAYGELESEGFVLRRRGVGLFVAEDKAADGEQQRLALLERPLREAALQAIQLGIDEVRLHELLSKLYRRLSRHGEGDAYGEQ